MKLKVISVFLFLVLFLVACGDEEVVDQAINNEVVKETIEEETIKEETIEEETIEEEMIDENEEILEVLEDHSVAEKGGVINLEQISQIIDYYGLREGDKLVNVTLENAEIFATIEVQEQMMAEITYADIADELLLHNGWDILTVDFLGYGKVSMNRSQQKDDGYGPYFPSIEIINQLERN